MLTKLFSVFCYGLYNSHFSQTVNYIRMHLYLKITAYNKDGPLF